MIEMRNGRHTPWMLLVVIVLFVACLAGCSDDPNATGVGFFDPIHVGTVETNATSDTTFNFRSGYSSLTILAGKSGDLEARSILEFAVPSSYDTLRKIDSASIKLWIRYSFRDSTGEYGMALHGMTRSWVDTSFRWDSVAGSFDPSASGTFLASIAPHDTIIRIRLDTALVRRWAQTSDRKGSVMLVPSVTSALVLGFVNLYDPNAPDRRPQLDISYHDTSDTAIVLSTRSSRGMFVANTLFVPPPGLLFVQAGVSTRAIIRFDSLSVPSQVAITRATVQIFVDESQSLTSAGTRDSIIVSLLRKNRAPYDSVALSVTCRPIVEGGQKRYQGDISAIVQQWTSREPNLGLLIRPLGETTTFDRFVFFNPAATTTLRPKITITYTKLQR